MEIDELARWAERIEAKWASLPEYTRIQMLYRICLPIFALPGIVADMASCWTIDKITVKLGQRVSDPLGHALEARKV